MAQYDWIGSAAFEVQIRARLQQRFAEAKIEGYPFSTAEGMVKIAKENQPELEERQKRSMAAARSMNDALESVDTIVLTAIELAQKEKRNTVMMGDITAAIQLTFCRVWPFCK